MKHKFSRSLYAMLAVLLVACLLMPSVSAAVQPLTTASTTETTKKYVALGDSMTNGYGMAGYFPALEKGGDVTNYRDDNVFGYERKGEASYPVIVAKEMGWELTHQLAISGMRPEELRYLLDPTYAGDGYTEKVFLGGIGEDRFGDAYDGSGKGYVNADKSDVTGDEAVAKLRETYQTAICEANVISMQFGANNLGTLVTQRLMSLVNFLAGTEVQPSYNYDIHLADLLTDPEINATYLSLKQELMYKITEQFGTNAQNQRYIQAAEQIVDIFAYGFLGLIQNFEICVDEILKLNPDVTIIIVGMLNNMDGMTVAIPGMEEPLDLSDLYDVVIDWANLFMAGLGEENLNAIYADPDGAELMVQAMASYSGLVNEDNKTTGYTTQDVIGMLLMKDFAGRVKDYAPLITGTLPTQLYDPSTFGLTDYVNNSEQYLSIIMSNVIYSLSSVERIQACITGTATDVNYTIVRDYVTISHNDVVAGIYEGLAQAVMTAGAKDDIDTQAVINLPENIESIAAELLQSIVDNGVKKDGIKTAVAAALSDPGIQSVLHVYARFMMGEGVGIHPSENGHATIAAKIINAYKNNLTGKDFATAQIQGALSDLYDLAVTYGPDVAETAFSYALEQFYANGYDVLLQEKLDELWVELEPAIAEAEAALNAEIARIEAELNQLYQYADTQLRPIIEQKIAELENAKRELIEELNALKAVAAELEAAIDNLIGTITGAVNGTISDAIVEVQKALDKVGDTIEEVEGVIDAITDAMGEIADVIREIEAAVDQAAAALKDTANNVYAKLQALQAELEAAYDQFVADMGSVEEAVDALIDTYNEALYGATYANYTMDGSSYYVSMGDSMATGMGLTGYDNYGYQTKVPESYPYKLALALNLNPQTYYNQLAGGGLRAEDMRYILDADYTPDDYTLNRTVGELERFLNMGSVDNVRAYYRSEIAKADLITINLGANNFTTFLTAQMNRVQAGDTAYAIDWSRYFDSNVVNGVNEAKTMLASALRTAGMSQANIDDMTTIIESYLYAYIGFAFNYTEVLNEIHEINPDALVIVVGVYNPMDAAYIDMGGFRLNVGELLSGLLELANLHYRAYAMLTPNTIFVEIPDTETFLDAMYANGTVTDTSLETFTYFMQNNSGEAMHADANGHEYIKNEILRVLAVNDIQRIEDILNAIDWADVLQSQGNEKSTVAPIIEQTALAALTEAGISGVTLTVNYTDFVAAVAGTSANVDGTNGTVKFTLTAQRTATGLSCTTDEARFSIIANKYTGVSDKDAVAAAAAGLKDGTVTVGYQPTQAEIDAAVLANVKAQLNNIPNAAGVDAAVKYISKDGNVYTYEVTLTKGAETATVVLKMTVIEGENPLASAIAALESNDWYGAAQREANTQADALSVAEARVAEALSKVDKTGLTWTVTVKEYVPAVAGTANNPKGTNGSITFTVTLSKGGITWSKDYTIAIIAEEYTQSTSTLDQYWLAVLVNRYNQKYPVIATAGEGGSISPDGLTMVQYKKSQTYTITPDEGYVIESVVVNGKEIGAVDTYTFKSVTDAQTISVTFTRVAWDNPFADVNAEAWYYDAVRFCAENGLMNGVSDTSFAPDSTTNRAMIVTVLYRLEGAPAAESPVSFFDVADGEWYTAAVNWASANEIVKGIGDSLFAPNNDITREQLAAIICRYASMKGCTLPEGAALAEGIVCSEWAANDVATAFAAGYFDAMGGDFTDMTKPATRAEIANTIYLFCTIQAEG